MRWLIALLLLTTSVFAQSQVTQQSPEQVYRQIVAVLAQENARLGAENDALRQQLIALQRQSRNEAPNAEHKPEAGPLHGDDSAR
jgi:hypothetical protein